MAESTTTGPVLVRRVVDQQDYASLGERTRTTSSTAGVVSPTPHHGSVQAVAGPATPADPMGKILPVLNTAATSIPAAQSRHVPLWALFPVVAPPGTRAGGQVAARGHVSPPPLVT